MMDDDISGPGSTSTQLFAQAFREAVADDTVGAILIDIDSPGGSVYGTSELAAEILQARNSKPVCAIANSLAASAAYWIGSAASGCTLPQAEKLAASAFTRSTPTTTACSTRKASRRR